MDIDLTEFFTQYEKIIAESDAAFRAVKNAHEDLVTCNIGCSDCCHALFDVSLVEALYLNQKFNEKLSEEEKGEILKKADQADRKIHQIKRQAYQAVKKGQNSEKIMARVAWERVRCPLLNKDEKCALYDFRPITCRLYGAPTAIEGKAHICGKTGFVEGKSYPTINLGVLNSRLYALGAELVKSIPTKFTEMHEMLVPVSMALLTVYDNEYLGIVQK